MESKYGEDALRVRLFVAGDSPSSRRALRAVELSLGAVANGQAAGQAPEFEVVDVLREPERALESKLLATPTLLIERGGQISRYVGDLSERDDVLNELSQLSGRL